MNRPPAFQFYPKDWMDFKVQRMSYEAQGIYMKMLCFMWNDSRDQCSIPNDDIIISKSLGITQKRWKKIREEIFYINDPIFKINGNKIISKRLKKEVKKLREYRRIQAEKGKKSALSRGTTVKPRLNHGATEGATGRQPEGNSSSSSSSSSSINNKESKDSSCLKKFQDEDIRLTQLLIDKMKENNPNSSIIRRLTSKRQEIWIDECRKLREIDERTAEQIEQIIIFSQNDSFWKANILSMPKLREKFDQLWLKAKKEKFTGIKEWLNEP